MPVPSPSPSPGPDNGDDEGEGVTVVTTVTVETDLSDASATYITTSILDAMGVDASEGNAIVEITQEIVVILPSSINEDLNKDLEEMFENRACDDLWECAVVWVLDERRRLQS